MTIITLRFVAFDVWYYDLCGHHFSKDSKDYDDDD